MAKIDFGMGVATPLIAFIYIAPACLWKAYVVTRLWDWYIVTGFGVPPLRMVIAYGLSVMAALMLTSAHGKDEREAWLKITMPFIGPAISLFAGWIGTFWL